MTTTFVVVDTTTVGAASEVADEVTETQEARGADGGDVELDNASGPVEQQADLPSPAAVLEKGAAIVAQAQPGDAAEATADAAPRDPEVDSLHNEFQRLSVTEQIAVPPTPL